MKILRDYLLIGGIVQTGVVIVAGRVSDALVERHSDSKAVSMAAGLTAAVSMAALLHPMPIAIGIGLAFIGGEDIRLGTVRD